MPQLRGDNLKCTLATDISFFNSVNLILHGNQADLFIVRPGGFAKLDGDSLKLN